MFALETTGLSYAFSRGEHVLRDVDLRVPAGSIYGFLGPNGAGKTTTLRLALGLLRTQQGSVRILGRSFPEHRLEILSRVGSLIETPSLYAHLTAEENLDLLRRIHRCASSRIGEALELTGLTEAARKKAGAFSLGMKQRLAIAGAILHRPPLLILDEPTNGLDPHGIIEMRALFRRLHSEEGTTILVSSHLLAEIERFATHVGVIHRGRMVFQGTLDAFTSSRARAREVVVETSDANAATRIAAESGWRGTVRDDGALVLPPIGKDDVARLVRRLVDGGLDVHAVTTVRGDLEEVFLETIDGGAA